METLCVFCGEALDDGSPTVTLGQKGCEGITRANDQRKESVVVVQGQKVHMECRRKYVNPNEIEVFKRKRQLGDSEESDGGGCSRRSSTPSFSYQDKCLFCSFPDKYGGRKKQFQLIPVRTKNFQTSLIDICNTRSDKWCDNVKGRLAFINDLHAADAVYHKVCNANFRSGKQIPLCFQAKDSEDIAKTKKLKTGRPQSLSRTEAFLKVLDDLRQNDNEQTTIGDLIEKMKEYLKEDEDPYSFPFMKQQLKKHVGHELVFTEIHGKKNIVTFRRKASSILNDFFKNANHDENDKERIVKTAAELIKSDIKGVMQSKDNYATSLEMSSVENSLQFIPESLQLLLSTIFVGKDKEMKICSIGQAIMQAARPRALLLPLQLGLGVQMHHQFASKFLIETLDKFGFTCSYAEVQAYERSAAITKKAVEKGFQPGHFIQYVADNADHNIRTIDGHDTFHGMGIIACITPKIELSSVIPRIKVTAKDIADVGCIRIEPYTKKKDGAKSLAFITIRDNQERQQESNDDIMWKISLSLCKFPRPGWSGMMKLVSKGSHPGQSSVMFLPMIDLDPGDLTCIHSTLRFVSANAQQYGVTPILTFDQPLWWKAMTMIENEPNNSPLKSIIVRLGGFHTLMSFLGSIGHLMQGSGLKELLELVYAPNTVPKMLEGKAIARAVRGHLLVDGALNTLLTSKVFNLELPCSAKNLSDETDPMAVYDEQDTLPRAADLDSSHPVERPSIAGDLAFASDLYDSMISGTATVVDETETLQMIADKIQEEKLTLGNDRTARFWIQYMKMIDIVRAFIRSERTGDWKLHLETLGDMMPYMAAAGHNLYVKSLNIYLQKMYDLEKTHPTIHKSFMQDGLQVVRRSNDYWAGLSTDLIIESVLMRAMKSTGGLTRGKGMTETQRLVWVLSNPVTTEVNVAMQEFSGVNFHTSDQHKDLSISRQRRDTADTLTILSELAVHSPFSGYEDLQNILNGMSAISGSNADRAKQVGDEILASMSGQSVIGYTFRRKLQAITMDAKDSLKVAKDEVVQIDPQLLFQRLIITGTQEGQLKEAFRYELCSYPPSLFETKDVLLTANKPQLAHAIWDAVPHEEKPNQENILYVLDGGGLLQRIPWETGETYRNIVKLYLSYVHNHYGQSAVVVFDGYEDSPSTKDLTHKKRKGQKVGRRIEFTSDMVLKVKKQDFLSHNENKQRFIYLLSDALERAGYEVHHAKGDADLLIVKTAVAIAKDHPTVLVGDDTDLLILLCHHFVEGELYFMPEPKSTSLVGRKYLNIGRVRDTLDNAVVKNILFVHAILGCDTTSRVFGLGKALSMRMIQQKNLFEEQARVFLNSESTREEVIAAGEKAMVLLYKGEETENLDEMRLNRFHLQVARSKTSIHPRNLPPTSGSTMYHSLRVFCQVQEWNGNTLDAEKWGWKLRDASLVPLHTDMGPAPTSLLVLIRCQCKSGCGTMRCSCRRQGFDCSFACSECKGVCANITSQDTEEEDDNMQGVEN